MKKITSILAIACTVLAMSLFTTSCEKSSISDELNYHVNIDKAVSQSQFEIPAIGGEVNLTTNLPFDAAVTTNGQFSIAQDKENKSYYVLSLGENKGYTRACTGLVSSLNFHEKIKDFGTFAYPVIIRQEGELGTQYLTKDELESLKSEKKVDWTSNDHFIKGTIKAIGKVEPYGGIVNMTSVIGSDFSFPLCPQLSTNLTERYNLEAIVYTVESEGVTLSVRAAWHKSYKLLSKMNVKVGDTVEIFVDYKGIDKGYETDLTINPLYMVNQ